MSENQPENKPASSFAENQLELRNYLKNHNFYHQYLDEDYPVKPFTIEHCLQNFTMLDILDENNKFVCDKCITTKDGKLTKLYIGVVKSINIVTCQKLCYLRIYSANM